MLHTYLLVDTARVGEKLMEIKDLDCCFKPLYKLTDDDLIDVTPYLFEFGDNKKFTQWFRKNGRSQSWGCFIEADLSIEELFLHFIQFLKIKTEDGHELYFRFYDPRVLKIFLPTCDTQQLRDFFGAIKSFVVEDEDPSYALIFSLNGGRLTTDRLPIEHLFSEVNEDK